MSLHRSLFRGFTWVVGIGVLAAILHVGGAVFARTGGYHFRREAAPQTRWAACNRNAFAGGPSTFRPLSDRAAAALVTPEPETRPNNAKPYSINGVRHPATNFYTPTKAQLAELRSARTSLGQPVLELNPYLRYVDGRDGLGHPSTDELIQWAAHKWGIPENWLRAEYVLESDWNSFMRGDLYPVPAANYRRYPFQARVPGTRDVYKSLGITQIMWDPAGDVGAGTEPLRWLSTAFNIDYQASFVRFFYDNPGNARKSWGDSTYRPCQKWNSIGGWFSPYPWINRGQAGYVKSVGYNLANVSWRAPGFLDAAPPIPASVKFR